MDTTGFLPSPAKRELADARIQHGRAEQAKREVLVISPDFLCVFHTPSDCLPILNVPPRWLTSNSSECKLPSCESDFYPLPLLFSELIPARSIGDFSSDR